MSKRFKATVPALVLVLCLVLSTAASAAGLDNFSKVRDYPSGKFQDVKAGSWYEEYIIAGYEMGLIDGLKSNAFGPETEMKVSESIKLAACLHSYYYNGEVTLKNGSPWYKPYVDYCLENGLLSGEPSNYEAVATRADFSVLFSKAMPAEALPAISDWPDGSIPDVSISDSYGEAVYMLYRAGILTGFKADGTFYPDRGIERSQMAAIISRMADESMRIAGEAQAGGACRGNRAGNGQENP